MYRTEMTYSFPV